MTIRAGGERLAHPATTGGAQAGVTLGRRPRRPLRHGPVLRWAGLVWLVAFLVLLANDPGRMFFETKLSVDLDPAGFYASLWHLMDPRNTFGALNNQAIGYAMPMGPFYLAGQIAHVPVWLTERLWLSLIIAVGFAGLVKLAEALGIGSPASRLLGGLVFALWPTFTIVIGSTSSAALPGMLAPWAVLPLTAAVPGRDGAIRGSVIRAAARSGVVVLCMSGVNATVTLEALLLPGLFILAYARGRRLVSLALCWGAAVAMATAWWVLPLLLQGKYAFNFLPYVEQASTTTGTESAAAALRGGGNWTAYLNLGTPWLPAGWAMVSTPMAIIVGAIAAACGLYGLALRNMPAGTWLRLCVGLAAAGALAGYGRSLGGPLHGPVDHLLDGAFAPFRNVYKLEPVIAAALALGLAHAAAVWLARTPGRKPSPIQRVYTWESRAVVGVVLIGLMLPYLSGEVLNPGSFTAVPRYWYQVAGFLADRSPQNTALVVPGDAHGTYLWGDPIDDPLVALAKSPWAEAGLVPYGGAGSQILLDTAEDAIDSGEQVSGLAGYLQRAGVRYVVVRNDLDPRQVGYTSAALVHQTLALSGYSRVASFGPPIGGAQIEPRATRAQQAAVPSFPAVEVYAPAGSPPGPPSPAGALPVSQTVLVNGGPDSLLQLTGQHLLGPGQPAIIAGDPLMSRPAQWAVTDGQRRADTLFGLVNANVSYTYTATETNPPDAGQLGRAGGPPRQLLPVPAAGHLTEAVLSGAASVTASSYGSWIADTQQEDPASAFDGNPATAWAEGDEWSPVKQWIQIRFAGGADLPASIGIRLLDDSTTREIASLLRVSTAAGSVTTPVAATGAVQRLKVVPGRTSWLRITIAGARRVHLGYPGAGISDVLIPGVRVTRLLQPAQDPAGNQAASAVFSFHQQVPSPAALADPAAVAPMTRTFTLAGPMTLRPQASALALPGPGLDALLGAIAPPGPGLLQVSVASTPAGEPTGFPASLISGSGSMPWTAESTSPVIHLSWQGQRRIGSLIVRPARGLPSTPQTVEITSPDGTRQASIGAGGLVRFPAPLTTDRIDVSFPRVRQATVVTTTGQLAALPVRLSQLSVPALSGLRPVTPAQQARFALACGQGPPLTVDGRVYQTSVGGTVGELSGYRPLPVQVCAPGGTLSFGAGRHTLTAAAGGTFAVTDLSLAGIAPAAATASGAARPVAARPVAARPVAVRSWQPDQRRVSIGPGAASYLVMHGNFNPGWGATLNGHALTAVRLDGWQQGFVVPAGPGGTITLSFRPAAVYHLALVVSLAAVAILLAVAAWSFIGRPRREDGRDSGSGQPWWPREVTSGGRRAWLGVLGVTALIFVAGGPVALAVPVLAYLAWRLSRAPRRTNPQTWLPWVAFAGMVASGLLSAIRPFGGGLLGSFGGTAQACALIALAAALTPAWPAITTGEDDR
ncbi:MAG TPA: alpha-(1-_3)-arabinofuranosyltransferase family protein [Streptosporangiaceae bacterium]|nr:alpha-(1->3)-arabinofuranosyltransferase family protein [Streptosporangiaceae bacterium]